MVTEAGFGADLGAEKFFDIKCRKAGLKPDAVVIVATVRALKMHGGVQEGRPQDRERRGARRAVATCTPHRERAASSACRWSWRSTTSPPTPTPRSQLVKKACAKLGVEAILSEHWAEGGTGIEELAREVVEVVDSGKSKFRRSIPTTCRCSRRSTPSPRRSTAPTTSSPTRRCATSSTRWRAMGYGNCRSAWPRRSIRFSTDPDAQGAPTGHTVPVREVRLSAGAGFVVVICGEIMTMPGLPKVPAAKSIDIDAKADRRAVLSPADNRTTRTAFHLGGKFGCVDGTRVLGDLKFSASTPSGGSH